jgi:hypothetical protein
MSIVLFSEAACQDTARRTSDNSKEQDCSGPSTVRLFSARQQA